MTDDEALLSRIEERDVNGVQALLKKGVSANAADKDGFTALIKSIVADDLMIMNLLLEAGASVDTPPFTHTAVRAATLFGRLEALEILLLKGADLSCPSAHGRTALMGCALPRKDIDRARARACARLILADPRGRASINARNEHKENALLLCRNAPSLNNLPVDESLETLLVAHGALLPS